MNICVFASGSGSNFDAILKYARQGKLGAQVKLLITNNSKCGAAQIAQQHGIEFIHISTKKFPGLSSQEYSNLFLNHLRNYKIDFIALAGYMKMLEPEIVRSYKDRIVNIHPSLLPAFGGAGMYGGSVHKAVINSGVKVSGITIHFVDETYDSGRIIFQKCVNISPADDEDTLHKKIQSLEHEYYPKVLSVLIKGGVENSGGKIFIREQLN